MANSQADGMMSQEPIRLSRREFVKRAGMVGAGTALLAGGGGIALLSVLVPPDRLPSLHQASFAARVGEKFWVRGSKSRSVQLELVNVKPLDVKGVPPGGEAFSILFRGPQDRALVQDTYQFQHGEIGLFSLFVVPGPPAHDAAYYEAIINRLPA